SELVVVVIVESIGLVVGLDAVKAEANVGKQRGREYHRIAEGKIKIVIRLPIADELFPAVVLVVRPERARRPDVAFLETAGGIEVVLLPVISDPRVDVVFAEILIAAEEEIVLIEFVRRRSVRQRIRVEKREPLLIEPVLRKWAGPLYALWIYESRELCALK